jgi:predicted aspartyl protease
VDSGATHNFVDKKLVKKMNWAVADTPPICIKLGDGSRVQAKGACQGMEIEIGGVQIEINAQLFDLGGVDVVLGVEWMSTLGDTIMN